MPLGLQRTCAQLDQRELRSAAHEVVDRTGCRRAACDDRKGGAVRLLGPRRRPLRHVRLGTEGVASCHLEVGFVRRSGAREWPRARGLAMQSAGRVASRVGGAVRQHGRISL